MTKYSRNKIAMLTFLIIIGLGYIFSTDIDVIAQSRKAQPSPRPTPTPNINQRLPHIKTNRTFKGNILRNSGFQIGRKLPAYWITDQFATDRGTKFIYEKSKNRRVKIFSPMVNDARWIQKVRVTPNQDYILVGDIKTRDVARGEPVDGGANLSILEALPNSFTRTQGLFGTSNWRTVGICFNSGSLSEITVAARLGMYSGTTTGTAWFDNVRLIEGICY